MIFRRIERLLFRSKSEGFTVKLKDLYFEYFDRVLLGLEPNLTNHESVVLTFTPKYLDLKYISIIILYNIFKRVLLLINF